MKTIMLTWILTLITAVVSLTGCQNMVQLGASPIPVIAYTAEK